MNQKMHLSIFITLLLLLLPTIAVTAQKEDKPPRKVLYGFTFDNLFFFGGGHFQFGLSPFAGYRIHERFSAGAGSNFVFDNNAFIKPHYTYGGNVFAEGVVIKKIDKRFPWGIIVHSEYQALNSLYGNKRETIEYFWIGPGANQRLTQNMFVNFMVLWYVNKPKLPAIEGSSFNITPQNPVFRFALIF